MTIIDDIARESDPRRLGLLYMSLLSEFRNARPIHDLAPLLFHEFTSVREGAAWVLVELGADAAPLLGQAPFLLASSSDDVRVCAIDFVLECAGDKDGEYLAKAIMLMNDKARGVRTRATAFLVLAEDAQLQAALEWLGQHGEVRFVAPLRSLLASDASDTASEYSRGDALEKKFAVAIALRHGSTEEQLNRLAVDLDEDASFVLRYVVKARLHLVRSLRGSR